MMYPARYGKSTFPEASFWPKLAKGQAYVSGAKLLVSGKVYLEVEDT